jgi:N-acetylglucosaminyldiphosphoundecaprenol N-acetyl-beta-D-mannosaminyltransferase
MSAPKSQSILGSRVDATTYANATGRIIDWAIRGESRYVCVANVNNAIEAYDDPSYQRVMNEADLVTPDGMPLVWALRALGVRDATRVYGPDLTPIVCAGAAREAIPVGFYGGTPEVLDRLVLELTRRAPGLQVAYQWSPPFRSLTEDENREVVRAINASGARILFVGLGAPKQERWIAQQRGHIGAVMVGVGAAFDFISGAKRQAPRALQASGLEWAFRLAVEPKRLWRRYLTRNPRFVALFTLQLIKDKTGEQERSKVRINARDLGSGRWESS